jgi:hypothetical protein
MRRLDRAALLAFVAETWAARGRETTTEGGVVLARDPETGVERRVAVATGRGRLGRLVAGVGAGTGAVPPPGSDRDVVVTPDPELARRRVDGRVRVLGPGDVRDLLRHGLDPETGTRLARTHLGLSLLVPEPESDRRSGPGGPLASDRPAWLAPAVVAVLAVLALAVAGAGLGSPPDVSSTSGSGSDDVASGAGGGDTAAEPASTPSREAGTQISTVVYVESMPPGLDRQGVDNVTRLATAHREILSRGPYALVVTVERTNAAGVEERTTRTSVRVWNRSVYRFNRTDTRWVDDARVTVTEEGYADGDALYLRAGDDSPRTGLRPGEVDPFTDEVGGLLRDALGTGKTSIRGFLYFGQVRYRIVAGDVPPLGGANANANASANTSADGAAAIRLPSSEENATRTAFATVRPTGLVRQLRVVSERPDGTRVAIRVRYVTVGYLPDRPTSLEPPSWYEAARDANATATGTENATATTPVSTNATGTETTTTVPPTPTSTPTG